MEKEIWKDIKGFEGHYEISRLGRVLSLKRDAHKILKLKKTRAGYYFVSLSLGGKIYYKSIHQLVAIAFLNHKPNGFNGFVVDHIDNNKLNNKLSNLQLITNRENSSKDKKGCSSKYVGVSWHKGNKSWYSAIRIKGKRVFIGQFKDEYLAHIAYQNKLKEING